MNICSFNALEKKEALELLIPCGQSAVWARNVAALRPFTSFDELRTNAALEWQALPEEEQSKALALHPLIGDVEMLKEKSQSRVNTKYCFVSSYRCVCVCMAIFRM